MGEGGEHALGDLGHHFVGHACHRILLMQHHGHAGHPSHQPAGHGEVATQTNHHIRLHALHHRTRLRKSLEQLERQLQQGLGTFAAHATELDRLQCKALRRHDARLHRTGGTQPMHIPATRTQLLRDRQTREDMPASATSHDQCGACLVLLNGQRHA